MAWRTILGVILSLWAGRALAEGMCREFETVPDSQVEAGLAKIAGKNAESAFDRLEALSMLSCEARPAVRDIALRTALESGDSVLAVEAAFRSLGSRSTFVVEFVSEAALTADQIAAIRKTPEIVYSVVFVDPAARCISLYRSDRCQQGASVFFSAAGVTLARGSHGAVFAIDGVSLKGEYDDGRTRLPARIRMF